MLNGIHPHPHPQTQAYSKEAFLAATYLSKQIWEFD